MTGRNIETLVDYENPPLVEVVCGVAFDPPPEVTVAHFGRYWSRLEGEFPEVKQVSPLPLVRELFGRPGDGGSWTVPLGAVVPRVWFINQQGDQVVQLQSDRFLCNWRKLSPEHPYPRYEWVIGAFERQLQRFQDFMEDELRVTPAYSQYELTYINHIPVGQAWQGLGDLARAFPDHSWRAPHRFLPSPEALSWKISFPLPEQMGRLHVHVQNGRRQQDDTEVLVMELTVRGFGPEQTAWFDLARKWIVNGFTDLTSQRLHEIWRRTK